MRHHSMDAELHDAALPSKRQRIRDARTDTETLDVFSIPAVQPEISKMAAREIDINAAAKRMLSIHNLITASGLDGLTRHEVAAQLSVEVNYITSSVLRLLKLGEIIETTRTRINQVSGKRGAVLIDKRFLYAQPKDAA